MTRLRHIRRHIDVCAIGGACAFGFALAWGRPGAEAAAPPPPEPIQVSVGGGAVDSAAFRWSSALAQVLSRPPGLPDCDPGGPCGVPGVVAGALTYDQPQALLKAVEDGRVTTGILPAMPIFEARCAPAKGQPPARIWALKTLYRQPLQIVVSTNAPVRTPKDFAGKTIAIGEHGTDAETLALALLDAYGAPRAKVKLVRLGTPQAIAALGSGTVTAAILLGHAFDTPIKDLMNRGGFTLLSLPDSPERQRVLRMLPVFEADAIPPVLNQGLPAISTLAQPVLWVAGPGLPTPVAAEIVAAVSEPHNATRLAELVEPVAPVPEGEAFLALPAPLADGAERFVGARHFPYTRLDCPAPAAH